MSGLNALKALLAASALALLAGGASAATCTVGEVTYTATQGIPDAVLGTNCQSGNDKNTLGLEGWILGDATDEDSDGLFLTIVGQTWTISNPLGYTDIILVLKQASSFGGFILDTTVALDGLWGTLGPGMSENDYSHISAWHKSTVAPVPVPAAGLLMIGALGGLAALRRRRRAV